MTISTVSKGEAVLASSYNQLVANVNGSPGRSIFTSSGTFTVPAGCHKFKVWICGAGGHGGAATGTPPYAGDGGDSPLVSALFSGVDVGTTFAITVGSVSSSGGGSSSFGTSLVVSGGSGGTSNADTDGADGSVTTNTGSSIMYHAHVLLDSSGSAYGVGGAGATAQGGSGSAGTQGVVMIEW